MNDGVSIACSFLTSQAPVSAQPAAGWPAVVLIAARGPEPLPWVERLAAAGYVVLTCDPRGQGASGGLHDLDGPRTLADIRQEFEWLASRPDVDQKHIGAWGISAGGGAVFNSTLAGVPWAAIETAETWVDLYRALAPHDLVKTGAILQLAMDTAPERRAPELAALVQDALAGTNLPALKAVADSRSPRARLREVRTPALIFQGRRDFVFDIDEGLSAYKLLRGPKRLFVGDFGHAPSDYPGPDIDIVEREAIAWFDKFLKGRPAATTASIELSPDPWTGRPVGYATVPTTRIVRLRFPGRTTIVQTGRIVRRARLPAGRLEVFGAPVVRARIAGSFTHLVAVLDDGATVVSEGGTVLSPGRKPRWVRFRLISDALRLPPRARLTLTLAATSTAQSPTNLLYLVGVPPGRRLTVGPITISLPVLKRPISQVPKYAVIFRRRR